MTRYLLYLCFLVWPFGLLLSFKLSFLPQPLYLLDLLVGVLFLLTIFAQKSRHKIQKNPLYQPLTIFLLILSLSLLINAPQLTIHNLSLALLYLARVFIYPVLYFVALSQKPQELLKIAFFSFSLFLTFGLFQYFFLPDLRFFKLLGFDDHYYRLTAGLLDPNFTGAIFASLPFFFLFTKRYLPLFFSLVALSLTFSRASYLSFFLSLLAYAFYFKKYKTLLLIALLTFAIYLAPKPFGEGVNLTRTFSILSRLESWQTGLQLFAQKPLLGWGYNTLTDLNGKRISIDNSFIYLLATSGLLGFLSFLNLLRVAFKNTSPVNRLVILSLLLHSLFNNSFFFIWLMAMFWITLALKPTEYKSLL